MTLLDALILGIIQGLTEFLPVSSSAHLVFFQHLLGFREPLVVFDVIVHLGTLSALFVYFAKDLAHIIRDSIYGIFFLFQRKPIRKVFEIVPYSRWAFGVITASIPTAIIGFVFKDWFESLFGSLHAVGIALFGTTLILWLTRYRQAGEKQIEKCKPWHFLIIGCMQGLAIIPGISRSGTTIAAGLFLGLEREVAFRFAFLLAIPAILGAGILELKHGFSSEMGNWFPFAAGFVSSALFGLFSLRLLEGITKKKKLHTFAIYTLLFGCLVLFLTRWLE
ncbi:MAG: undecaprenyl-diphosphate phosphatase [Candidatus Omnitrophica bacterium]|nr:undecaprenyl-diphosphate phosphatase [Candidatus Omnitrophota bacterium]